MVKSDGWRLPSDPPECPEGGVVDVIVGLLTETGEWHMEAVFYANKCRVEPLSCDGKRPKRYEVSGFVCYEKADFAFDEIEVEAWHPFPEPPSFLLTKGGE